MSIFHDLAMVLLMRCVAVRYGAVRCVALRYGALRAVRCGAVRAVRCGAVCCGAVRCGACGAVWCGATDTSRGERSAAPPSSSRATTVLGRHVCRLPNGRCSCLPQGSAVGHAPMQARGTTARLREFKDSHLDPTRRKTENERERKTFIVLKRKRIIK